MLFTVFTLLSLGCTILAARPHDRFLPRANRTTATFNSSNSTTPGPWDGESSFKVVGMSGVGGMQISVVSDDKVISFAFLPADASSLISLQVVVSRD